MTLWRPIFYSILWFVFYFRHRESSDLAVITQLTLTQAIEQIPQKHVQYLAHLAKHVDIQEAGIPELGDVFNALN